MRAATPSALLPEVDVKEEPAPTDLHSDANREAGLGGGGSVAVAPALASKTEAAQKAPKAPNA